MRAVAPNLGSAWETLNYPDSREAAMEKTAAPLIICLGIHGQHSWQAMVIGLQRVETQLITYQSISVCAG